MNRFRSLKDIEKEKYRLYLERELVQYKLNYFIRNAKSNWSPEKLIQNGIGSLVYRFVTGLIQKKNDTLLSLSIKMRSKKAANPRLAAFILRKSISLSNHNFKQKDAYILQF